MYIFGGPDSPPPVEGVFISRPNRFIVIAETGGKKVRVHCPNPGRIWEILHPGRKLLLSPSENSERKTPFSLAAALYRGKTIPLNAAGSNRIAAELIIPALFPDAENIKAEFTLPESPTSLKAESGKKKTRSRFDFYLETGNEGHIIEVKSCTLSEEGTAMFPDAPTERGRRHLEEMTELSENGRYKCHVVLVIHHGDTKRFIPNFHTDPEFAFALEKALGRVEIHAVSAETEKDGCVSIVNLALPVEFTGLEAAKRDLGVFMITLKIDKETKIPGETLQPGWYIFIESPEKELSSTLKKRINRKNSHGSSLEIINYHSSYRKALPIYTLTALKEEVSEAVSKIADGAVSDYFFFKDSPLKNPDFTRLLFYYRNKRALEG